MNARRAMEIPDSLLEQVTDALREAERSLLRYQKWSPTLNKIGAALYELKALERKLESPTAFQKEKNGTLSTR